MNYLPKSTVHLALALVVLGSTFGLLQTSKAASWITNGSLTTARYGHGLILLHDGKVLAAGGYNSFDGYLTKAELYDPATGQWTLTGELLTARRRHTTTLLPNGKVLIVGGTGNGGTYLASAEIYDPSTRTWEATRALSTVRAFHTATLLFDGTVLITGGGPGSDSISSAVLYRPATATWLAVGSLNVARRFHTATLLSDGRVLVVGGAGVGYLASAEIYNPSSKTWTLTSPPTIARAYHTATLLPNGKVLVAGGFSGGVNYLTSLELFDPNTGIWTNAATLLTARTRHTATLLPSGKVLLTGGDNNSSGSPGYLSDAESFDPDTLSCSATASLNTGRNYHSATLLANGRVLVAGGGNFNFGGAGYLTSTELYDSSNGTWTNTGAMGTARHLHTTTLLPNGKVMSVGGFNLSSAELYDPASGAWTTTGSMNTQRDSHTITLLPNGRALVVGGIFGISSPFFVSSAELYDPVAGTWTNSGYMAASRGRHTATLLLNGKVLVAAGFGPKLFAAPDAINSAELFDPTTGSWTGTGPLNLARYGHTATLLPNGKVLVAGGENTTGYLRSAELFDPTIRSWTVTGLLNRARYAHTATLLPNGKVLVAGGRNASGYPTSAELYDPATGTWTNTGALNGRVHHTATLLPNGKVLVSAGGVESAQVYDPVSGAWTTTSSLATPREFHEAVLLPNGKLLITGGFGSAGPIKSTELYDVGLGFNSSWQPQVTTSTSPLNLGNGLAITGSKFRGISGASGGNTQDSSSDYPLVQLRSIESGQTTFLLTTNWSPNSFTSLPVWNFPPGYALATVFVNGIPSTSSIVNITVPVPIPPTITNAKKLTNGTFQFAFANSVGAMFGASASTNVSLPLSNWTALGAVTEISPGKFQFTDPQATNSWQRFYRVQAN